MGSIVRDEKDRRRCEMSLKRSVAGKKDVRVSNVKVRDHGGVVSRGNSIPLETELYGFYFMELDEIDGRDSYVAAFGCPKKVQAYKEDVRGKGKIQVYKSQRWLIKRLEKLRDMYGDHLTFVHLK